MEKIFFIDRLETYKIRGLYVTVCRFYYSKTYHAREVPLTWPMGIGEHQLLMPSGNIQDSDVTKATINVFKTVISKNIISCILRRIAFDSRKA